MGGDWKQEARKLGCDKLVEKLIDMETAHKALLSSADTTEDRMRDAEVSIQRLYSAFPSSDIDGHRRYHELIIAQTEELRQLKVAIREKTYSGLIWAAIVGFAVMVWTGFLHIIGK